MAAVDFKRRYLLTIVLGPKKSQQVSLAAVHSLMHNLYTYVGHAHCNTQTCQKGHACMRICDRLTGRSTPLGRCSLRVSRSGRWHFSNSSADVKNFPTISIGPFSLTVSALWRSTTVMGPLRCAFDIPIRAGAGRSARPFTSFT